MTQVVPLLHHESLAGRAIDGNGAHTLQKTISAVFSNFEDYTVLFLQYASAVHVNKMQFLPNFFNCGNNFCVRF